MNYTNKVCSFTGYRTGKLRACLSGLLTIEDIRDCLKSRMIEMIDEGFMTFQCGMAIGSDMLFAEIALELRQRYSSLVRFVAVIPCLEHDKNWNEYDRNLCREMTEKADDVVIVSNTRYFDGCMAKRNRYLIENCDELVAIYDGQKGGTMQTINFAKGKGMKVTIIDPSKSMVITLRESFGEILTTEKSIIELYGN
ncbi:MAG: SLOG family protein [Oscillospiraceae bacterium]|nr:SLOG family protein [Oscillospiraceae bacterium]